MSSRQRDLFEDQLPPWEQDAGSEVPSATIVLSEAPWGPFSYRIPDRFAGSLQPGMRVVVPLGKSNRPVLGYCMAIEVAKVAPASLKEVTKLVDDQPLCDGPLLKLIEWMSVYYLVPLGQVFEAVVPAGVRAAAGTREKSVWRLTDSGQALAEGRSSPADKG
ncbi:MAG: primosomal protein N', partial [Pirellulaceae bacterium]